MLWKKHTLKPLEAIAKTGFLVSLTSYIVFWFADIVKPGFVSRYFSVHVFLLAVIVFGWLWSSIMEEYTDRVWAQIIVAVVFGVLAAVVTWHLSKNIGWQRILPVLIASVTPIIIFSLIRS